MGEGLKVEGGDRLDKTVIYARNHDHAKFIEDRFNFHYPQYASTSTGRSWQYDFGNPPQTP